MLEKFIIDTDTASDDAVALIMAVRNPAISVETITVVAGNVALDQAIQNAMYTLSLCDADVPVYGGMSKPLIRDLSTADHVHGKDGMSDLGLPLHGFTPESTHAVPTLIEKIAAHPDEITLVCLGPLTNIAMAVLLDKAFASNVKQCVIMGGIGQGRGNVTPLSEYNFWVDPEAAKIVFESGMPIKMVGWDISRAYAVFESEDVKEVKAIGTPLASFAMDIQQCTAAFAKKMTKLDGFDLPDPIAMSVAIDPSIAIKTEKAVVKILLNDDDSRGQSVMDYVNTDNKETNAEIVLEADREKFISQLHHALA